MYNNKIELEEKQSKNLQNKNNKKKKEIDKEIIEKELEKIKKEEEIINPEILKNSLKIIGEYNKGLKLNSEKIIDNV